MLIRIIKSSISASVKVLIHLVGNITIKPFLLFRRKKALTNLPENPKILYVSLAFRGDLILSFPAIKALKARFPKSFITIWVREFNSSLTELSSDIDRTLTYDKFDSNGIRVLRELFPKNIHQGFLNKIRRTGYDLYVDDSGYTFSSLLGMWANIPLRIGRNQQGFGYLNHYDFPYDGDSHIIERKFRLLGPLGIKIENEEQLRPNLEFPPNMISIARKKAGLDDIKNGYFVISPFTGWQAKNWDTDKYIYLIAGFARYTGLIPVFLGGPNDSTAIDEMVLKIEIPCRNLAGKLSLAESAAIISKAQIHIGGDTFSSHVAAATMIKSLSIFGPTNPKLSAYLTINNIAVLKRTKCTPPVNKIYCCRDAGRSCQHVSCMRELRQEDVLAVLKDLWDGKIKSKVIEF
jgi:heptosyltransferase I